MNKRSIACSVAAIFIIPSALQAQVIFSEIMYDLEGTDTGREWVEVHNGGSGPIDLSLWKLFEANISHKITAVGDAIVQAGGFAVIADAADKFMNDHSDFSGLLFDSAFSLNNEGETLVLRDENGADIDTAVYTSAIGGQNGNSIHRQGSGWLSAAPSPGSGVVEELSNAATSAPEQKSSEPSPARTNSSGMNGYSSHSSQADVAVGATEPVFTVSSGRRRLGFTGVPLSFEARIIATKPSSLGNTIRHSWSFGDGMSLTGGFVSHAYAFPGDYTVVLNSEAGADSAVSRTKVRIVDPEVEVAYADASYIELHNQSALEVNIGNWILEAGRDRATIPKDTIIEARSSIKIPVQATRLKDIQGSIRLFVPSGRAVSAFDLASTDVDEIAMPQGVTIDTIKERFQMAMAAKAERIAAEAEAPVLETIVREAATTSAAASVILVVPETIPEAKWWKKLMSSLK